MNKINYKAFMDEIKAHVTKMKKSELTYLIYQIARMTKESERAEFLDKFIKYGSIDRSKEIGFVISWKIWNYISVVQAMRSMEIAIGMQIGSLNIVTHRGLALNWKKLFY